MQSRCELIDYKVPSFMYDVNVKNKEKKSRKISFENAIKISVSDKDESKGVVCIQTKVSDEEGEIKYSIEIRGVFRFASGMTDEEEKEKILKEEGFKKLYSKLDGIIRQTQDITKQKLPELPSLNDIDSMD